MRTSGERFDFPQEMSVLQGLGSLAGNERNVGVTRNSVCTEHREQPFIQGMGLNASQPAGIDNHTGGHWFTVKTPRACSSDPARREHRPCRRAIDASLVVAIQAMETRQLAEQPFDHPTLISNPLTLFGFLTISSSRSRPVLDSPARSFGTAYPPSAHGYPSETCRRPPGLAERRRRDA